jgi:hypothetical protein
MMNRRHFLGSMTAAAMPATAVVAVASPEERARFHAKALAEAMAEIHPERSWRHAIDHKNEFVLVVGDKK